MFPSLRQSLGAIGALTLLVTAAPAAAATSTCSYDETTRVMTVRIAGGETARLVTFFGAIKVQDGDTAPIDCDGPLATVENTDEVQVYDLAPEQVEHLVIADPHALVDSTGDEVLVDVDLGAKNDEVTIVGTSGGDRIALGSAGINRNYDEALQDGDIFVRGVEQVTVQGRGDNDGLLAQGDAGVGAPVSYRVVLLGGGGSDAVVGGDGTDRIVGGPGRDHMHGGGGYDELAAAGGGDDDHDFVFTGDGGGVVSYADAAARVKVDLALTTEQDTGGGGRDKLEADEVSGSRFNDVLRGNANPNVLVGAGGHDQLEGRAAGDFLIPGSGADTISYASSPAGVRVSLFDFTATGGHAEGDLINWAGVDIPERIAGSRHDDVLEGDARANRLSGGKGRDHLRGRGGPDLLAIRDSGPDRARCDGGADTVVADAAGIDTIDADCETIQR